MGLDFLAIVSGTTNVGDWQLHYVDFLLEELSGYVWFKVKAIASKFHFLD